MSCCPPSITPDFADDNGGGGISGVQSVGAGTHITISGTPTNPIVNSIAGVTAVEGLQGSINLVGIGCTINAVSTTDINITVPTPPAAPVSSVAGATGAITMTGSGCTISGANSSISITVPAPPPAPVLSVAGVTGAITMTGTGCTINTATSAINVTVPSAPVSSVAGATGIITMTGTGCTITGGNSNININVPSSPVGSGVSSLNTMSGNLSIQSSSLIISPNSPTSGILTMEFNPDVKTVTYTTSGSYVALAGYNFARIILSGGGGGGGGCITAVGPQASAGGGASGETLFIPYIPITGSETTFHIVIGAGGLRGDSGPSTATNGSSGDPTSININTSSTYSVLGGGGGYSSIDPTNPQEGGSGGDYGGGGGHFIANDGIGGTGMIANGENGGTQPFRGGAGGFGITPLTFGGGGGGARGGHDGIGAGLGGGGEGASGSNSFALSAGLASSGGSGYVSIEYFL